MRPCATEAPTGAIAEWLPALKEHKAELLGAFEAKAPVVSWAWLLAWPDGHQVAVYAWPKPTRERVLTTYPEAIDAGPFEPAVTSPEAPVSLGEQRAIRAWLGHRRDRPGHRGGEPVPVGRGGGTVLLRGCESIGNRQ